ncbi:phage baseplate assembly protein V [Salmonella enterica subsp. diarizonae]|nr:phage baseplate assembly protein V [Salmonella enterica subsp. diarizonae]
MEKINDSVMNRLLAPVMRRVRLMLARAVVNVINDGLKVQNLQAGLLDDEECDDIERLQNYGHFSVPLPGAEALIACVGAQRDQGVAVVVEDRRYRPTNMTPGDAGIYHFEGHRIRLTKDGRCIITCKTLEVYADERVTFDAPKGIFTGDLTVKGKTKSEGNITAPDAILKGKSTVGHRHQEHGDGGGITGPMQ